MQRFFANGVGSVPRLLLIFVALAFLGSCGPKISFEKLEEVRDPKNRFVVKLPKGFTMENKSDGEKTLLSLSYKEGYNITFISNPMIDPEWERERAMLERVNKIKSGDFQYPTMKLIKYNIIDFGGGQGYYLLMQGTLDGKQTRSLAYALVGNGSAFAISLVCTDNEQCDTFRDTIKNTFVIQ